MVGRVVTIINTNIGETERALAGSTGRVVQTPHTDAKYVRVKINDFGPRGRPNGYIVGGVYMVDRDAIRFVA